MKFLCYKLWSRIGDDDTVSYGVIAIAQTTPHPIH